MLKVPNVQCAVIFDRRLGCADESARDDELADKILFFYPPSVDLNNQLTKVNMLEGLIEFSNKFSSHPLDDIIMRDNTWAFVQCEPDIWIAVSVSNRYDIEGQHIPLQTPNPAGLQSAIKTMYQYLLLYVLHRPLRGYLEEGWEQIANVMALRKKVRKLRMRSCQEEQDIHAMKAYDDLGGVGDSDAGSDRASTISKSRTSLDQGDDSQRFSEQLGIRKGAATHEELSEALAKTFAEIAEGETALTAAMESGFRPRLLSRRLTTFMTWYIGCGELLSPSFLHEFNGMHYAPMARTCLPLMMQYRYGLEDTVGAEFYRGSTYLYNGQIAQCDMDNEEYLSLLYNFIRLKEASRIIDGASTEFSAPKHSTGGNRGDEISRKPARLRQILSFGRRHSSSITDDVRKSEQAISEWVSEMNNGKGFITKGWDDSDDLGALVSGDIFDWTAGSEEPCQLWCPSYLSPELQVNSNATSISNASDRVVLYRHGRFLVILLLAPDALLPVNAIPLLRRVQDNLNSSIPKLLESIEGVFRNSIVSNKGSSSAATTPVSSPQPPPHRDSRAPQRVPQIRIFYANEAVKAIKISGSKVWTPPLPKSVIASPSNSSKSKSRDDFSVLSAENLFQEPLLYCAAAQVSLLTHIDGPANFSELSNDEVNAILELSGTGSFKFASPSSHTAVSIPPDVLNALNGLNESLVRSTTTANVGWQFKGKCREACVRVAAVEEGGKWVFARVRGDRRAFVLVEGCSTLNEMYSVVNDIFDGILGSVMI